MQVYLVRHIDTKEVQGIFWGSKAEVWDCFDEMGDPSDCEYAPLRSGALYTHARYGEGQKAIQFDVRADDDDQETFCWDGFEMSEGLLVQMGQQSTLRWRRFDFSDVGDGLVARIQRSLDNENQEREAAE